MKRLSCILVKDKSGVQLPCRPPSGRVMQSLFIHLSSIPVSKKNNKNIAWNHKTGKPFIISSGRYNEWHRTAMAEITSQSRVEFDCPVKIQIDYYFPSYRRTDLDNKTSSILDLLVDSGILTDDNWRAVPELIITGNYSHNNPHTNIKITEIQNETDSGNLRNSQQD